MADIETELSHVFNCVSPNGPLPWGTRECHWYLLGVQAGLLVEYGSQSKTDIYHELGFLCDIHKAVWFANRDEQRQAA